VLAFDTVLEEIGRPSVGSPLTEASDSHRFRAIQALSGVDARGGTELGMAIMSGLQRLEAAPIQAERF